MSDHVISHTQDGILKLQLNRPEKKNALTAAMYSALVDGLKQAETDPSIRVIYLTGSADSFTSGNDLMDFLQNPPTDPESSVSQFLYQISHASKPIVTAVNGLAIGVGVTMLLHCDLVYAASSAKFQLPFVNLAVVPEAASSYLLPRMMGHQKAAELLMLGEMFDAEQAAAVGIVNRVLLPNLLQDVAWEKAVALSKQAPEALRLTKMLLKKGQLKAIEQTMQEEGVLFQERLASAESREVMMAFMEKRAPKFG